MEPEQSSKQQGQAKNTQASDIYIGPLNGKWTVAQSPDLFGEPFDKKELAMAEAKRRVEEQKQSGVADAATIKVYNKATQQFDV
jgi:hypothetical protein